MYEFVEASPSNKFPNLKGWYLKVTTVQQLIDYWEAFQQDVIVDALSSLSNKKSFDHCLNNIESMIEMRLECEALRLDKNSFSIIDNVNLGVQDTLGVKLKILQNIGCIFVNDNGGFLDNIRIKLSTQQ